MKMSLRWKVIQHFEMTIRRDERYIDNTHPLTHPFIDQWSPQQYPRMVERFIYAKYTRQIPLWVEPVILGRSLYIDS